MAKKRQAGFTLFELTVSAGLFTVLSALTILFLQDYSLQARILKGLTVAGEAKTAVAEYYSRVGEFPGSSQAAGVGPAGFYANDYVQSVSVGNRPVNGTITIAYTAAGSIAAGDSLLLVPAESAGRIVWSCRTRTLVTNLLPTRCT